MSNQLDERIRRMMQQVVDEAPPPPDMSDGMPLTPVVERRVPNWAFAAAAAAVVLVLLGGTGWLFGGYGTDVVGEPVPFDFASGSLCEWFSASDIKRIVASAYEEHGLELPTQPMTQGRDGIVDCLWGGDDVVHLGKLEWNDTSTDPFVSHRSLSDAVRVRIRGHGDYGLTDGVDATLAVDGHDELLWFGFVTGLPLVEGVEVSNSVGLTIANKMLQEMGWIDDN